VGLNIIGQGVDKMLGFPTPCADKDSISPMDMTEDQIFSQEFLGKSFFPLFNAHGDLKPLSGGESEYFFTFLFKSLY
jgi:hypothetical protein